MRCQPFLLAILLGALAACGFAPLGWWPLTIIALAGLLWLAEPFEPDSSFPRKRESSKNRVAHGNSGSRIKSGMTSGWKCAFLTGWCFGLGHFTVGNNWIAHAFTYQDAMPHWLGYGAVVALALYLAVYPGFALLGLHLVRRRWPLAPAPDVLAALWIVTEYGRATIFTGFAWDPLGMIWLDTGVDQAARWIGTYGLSGLAVLAGGALLSLARRRWKPVTPLIVALIVLAVYRKAQIPDISNSKSNIAITVVQPNIDQNEKYDAALEQANFAKLETLTRSPNPSAPRLIFWPEAAIPAWLDMEPEWRDRLAALQRPGDLLMTGGVKPYFRQDPHGIYSGQTLIGGANSAWVLAPGSKIVARYDKAHLVPYGEYLPMRSILQPLGLSRLVPGDVDFWPGPGPRTLTLPMTQGLALPSLAPATAPLKMGVQICYEIIFSGEVVHRANRPEFLYNPSNDAWFGSWGPPEHLAQARMRAIEEAMPIIRSTPNGISAVIDGHGRILASIPHHQMGAIHSFLPPALPPTLFSRFGNLLPMLFSALLVAFSALTAISLARKPHAR